MSQRNPNFYCVISVKDDMYETVKTEVLKYNKFHCSAIVEEFGQNGNHPHLNILFFDNPDRRTDSITRTIKTFLNARTGYEFTPNSIKTKLISDLNGLVRYIVKEPNCEILRNEPGLNIELIKATRPTFWFIENVKEIKWKQTLTLNNAPLVYVEYCKTFKLDVVNVDHNLHLMTKDGINVIIVLRQIKVFRQIVKYLTTEPNFEEPNILTMLDI